MMEHLSSSDPFQKRVDGIVALQKMLSNHHENLQNGKYYIHQGIGFVEKYISVFFCVE